MVWNAFLYHTMYEKLLTGDSDRIIFKGNSLELTSAEPWIYNISLYTLIYYYTILLYYILIYNLVMLTCLTTYIQCINTQNSTNCLILVILKITQN